MDAPLSAGDLSDLIGTIYDCAIDPRRWPVAMEAMRQALGFRISMLNLQALPSCEVLLNVSANLEPHYHAMADRAGADVAEQWGGLEVLQSLPLDEPAVLSWTNPAFDPSTTTNRYYLDFAKPQKLIDVLAFGLARDGRGLGSLSFGRHESEGPIGRREVELARLLLPHVQRAATINRLLDMAALARASFESVIDILTVPLILTGSRLQIVHANPAAQRLLDQQRLVRRRRGALQLVDPTMARALSQAVGSAAQGEWTIGRKGLGIPLREAGRAAGALHVLPVGRRLAASHDEAVAAIFIADIAGHCMAPAELAAALFGLTASEAKCFDLLAAGRSAADAAAALGVAPSTLKTHMRNLYEKIGIRSRSHLVKVAAALTLPV